MDAIMFEGDEVSVFQQYKEWLKTWGPSNIVSTALACNASILNSKYTLIVTYKRS